MYSSKLCIGIRTSKSFALSIFTPLIFEIQLINGALFLKTDFLSPKALLFALLVALINCEVELILTWFKNIVLIDKSTREANYDADPNVYETDNPGNATFKIIDVKLFVPVVTLSEENDIKLLQQLKTGFKRTIKWNKYRSQISIQPQNNNLNYLIDPTFTNVNTLFVLYFQEIIILK